MSFFVGSNKTEMDEAFNPEPLMRLYPEVYGPRFEAIAELRSLDDGTLHKGNEFRRVASLVNVPLAQAALTVLDPEWLMNKPRFYEWLDRNREYCTYQRPTLAGRAAQVQRDIGHITGPK